MKGEVLTFIFVVDNGDCTKIREGDDTQKKRSRSSTERLLQELSPGQESVTKKMFIVD